jgi:hypothetical protein
LSDTSDHHLIRLRDAWETRVSVAGVVYFRRFGRPTGLAPGQRVELRLEHVGVRGVAALNGRVLGPFGVGPHVQFEVRDLLAPRNELRLEVESPGSHPESPASASTHRGLLPSSVIGLVSLAIHEP